jgi:G patch domain-containing protein 1
MSWLSRGQRVEDFMDDDELAEAGISKVQPTAEYDTFGSTAAELARKQAMAEASARADGQLSFLPEDIIAPVADSMGDCQIHLCPLL